jgi:UDP-glucose 4-epimerase|tara:strand:- start:3829 stop:4686 length:858 start_codon:yes stop_codon:yes gene_type:complete
MKILVTGGNGFIGSNLIKKLLKEGHEVVSLDDLSTGLKEYEVEGCTYVYGDIENLLYWKGESFDLCYHLAALARIQPSFDDPMETFRVDTQGVLVVAEWARQNNVKVVYSGSSSKWCNPETSPYATCKKLGEDVLKMYRTAYGCDFEIARFYNVYGPNELVDGKWAAVIGIWRKQIEEGKPITIISDGEQKRDFTHVDDICDALYKIGMEDKKHEDAWELGTGMNYSINEVYDFFTESFGIMAKVHLPDVPGNYRETLRENDDTLERLGWEPKDKLRDYILSLNS